MRAQGDLRRLLGREGERFIAAVGVQRLAAAEDGGHGLVGDADDVVLRLLRGQGRAGRLRVEAQSQGAQILWRVALPHQHGP